MDTNNASDPSENDLATTDMAVGSMRTAVRRWKGFLPAWAFPVFFLFGGIEADKLGHPMLFFWLLAVPAFFASFFRAASAGRGLSYGVATLFTVGIPLLVWTVAVVGHAIAVR